MRTPPLVAALPFVTARPLVTALLGIPVLLLALGVWLSPAAVVAEGEEITWLSDLDDAREQARESGRLILAVFR